MAGGRPMSTYSTQIPSFLFEEGPEEEDQTAPQVISEVLGTPHYEPPTSGNHRTYSGRYQFKAIQESLEHPGTPPLTEDRSDSPTVGYMRDVLSSGQQERLASAGFPLDRYKSAGRETLASRGYGDSRASLPTSQSGTREALDTNRGRLASRGGITESSSLVSDRGTFGRASIAGDISPSARVDMMSTGGQRPLTSAGRMSRTLDQDGAGSGGPTRAVHPERRGGDGGQLSRPTTSGRMMTARPVSAALKGAPSTATRLLTAATARPGTRGGLATARGLNTPINVVDRPITQQGLTGMKTGSRGPQRQVQDKTYFMGLLRAKMSELGDEINKLGSSIHDMKLDQNNYLTYDKRVKETAQELTELQGSLADYNLLVDLMSTDTEKLEIDEECQELEALNQEEANTSDSLFGEKQELEAAIRALDSQLEDERHMGESIIEGMQPELKGRYVNLRDENVYLLQQQEQMQQDLDKLNNRRAGLEDEMTLSKVKQEAVVLSERLQELQEKRDQLQQEKMQRGTPKEERERLLLQVKDDNSEIATMERRIADLQEEFSRHNTQIHELEHEIDESQSERSQKYRELRKREETMEQFMTNFEQSRLEEMERLEDLENKNVEMLEKLSRNMLHFGGLPNVAEYDALKGDLAFKEGELEKSKYTTHSLQAEHINLQANLQKIEALETKVQKELVDVKEKLRRMENELEEFSDVDGLRSRAEVKRKDLAVEKDQLEAKKTAVTFSLRDVENAVKMVKKQLTENDTHSQLVSLEKKWSIIEQNNFNAREFVAQKKAESDYVPVKNMAMKMVVEYNKVLQEVIASGGIIV